MTAGISLVPLIYALLCILLLLEEGATFSLAPRRIVQPSFHQLEYTSLQNRVSCNRILSTRICGTQLTDEEDNGSLESPVSDKLLGILVLLTVPIAWGTYTPVVKYLYAIKPAVPGFVFSACYYALAAVTMSTLVAINGNTKESSDETTGDENTGIPILGGLELGSYLFIANCLQVIGLQTVQSDRAGFLVQFTTVMVPFAEALFAGNLLKVPIRTWLACIVAFLGLFVMGLDGKSAGDPVSALFAAVSSFSRGDSLILGAAVLYTLHVVRLGTYAKETTPLKLAATKASVETVFSVLLLVFLGALTPLAGTTTGLLGFAADLGKEITSFYSSFGQGISTGSIPLSALFPAIGAVLWTGECQHRCRVVLYNTMTLTYR